MLLDNHVLLRPEIEDRIGDRRRATELSAGGPHFNTAVISVRTFHLPAGLRGLVGFVGFRVVGRGVVWGTVGSKESLCKICEGATC